MTEHDLQPRVLLILGSDPDGLWHENIIGSGCLGNSQRFRKYGYANPGGADIIGCFRGHFVAVELKSSVGRQRPEQRLFQQRVERHGGVYAIVRSEDDARALLATLRARFTERAA